MALLRYMTVLPRRNAELPDPAGPLSSSVPSMAIEQANAAVARVRQDEAGKTNAKGGPYIKLNDEMRAKIGKYASENGDTAAARHFSKVLGKALNRSTVRGMKKCYPQELSRKRKAEEGLTISSLPSMCENKTGENLTLCSCDRFGEIFSWRKFSAIR